MADQKISALTSATLPLAGTEVLPIVQSSTTVKVAVDNLTVKNVRSNATTGLLQVAGPGAGTTRVMTTPDANFSAARTDAGQTFTGDQIINGTLFGKDKNYASTIAKVGVASNAAAFTTFTVDMSAYSSFLFELSFTAIEAAVYFASTTRRWVFNIQRDGGAFFASTVNSVSAYQFDRSNANWAISPSLALTVVSNSVVKLNVTLTSTGALTWATAPYSAQLKLTATGVPTIT